MIPSEPWEQYLLYGSLELLVIALLVKLFLPANPPQQVPVAIVRTDEVEDGAPIGVYRNRMLAP